ncbi:DUF2141 domain-containing protein [uncultured Draconibacterium sp.]|uniref:DUF2141 domain-containing protein n=1 Tax=uncultured Draconibacterium sp. TaxID=1573823 RepID=UPI00321762C9
MKNLILLLTILLLAPAISFGQITLVIEIEPLRNSDGKILLEFNNENEEVIKGITEKITDNKCTIQIKDLKPGKYAFKYFHDENNDKKLTTNFVGMPKEGFGFSNDAKGKFGPPPFDKMIFELSESTSIKCIPVYILKQK